MIQDVLSTIFTAGRLDFLAAEAPPNDIAVNNAGVGGVDFSDNATNKWFEPGDNFLLQRLWVNIPYGFGQGTGKAAMELVFADSVGALTLIPELGEDSRITIPDFCGITYPGDGLFIRVPTGLLRRKLVVVDLQMRVSMVNLPTALVGVTVSTQFHLMIRHTRPLVLAP